MQLNEAVSRRLVELMQERGMTQYQLYMKSGVPKSTILGTADGKLMSSSCLVVPVMRINKSVRCCKGNGRERQHSITPVNVH